MCRSSRGVAQFGRAPGLGPGGRRFKSCRPDSDGDKVIRTSVSQNKLRHFSTLLHSRPHSVHVVVFVKCMEELADFFQLGFGQGGEDLGEVADFAGDHCPAVG